jgi:hypothetical protein
MSAHVSSVNTAQDRNILRELSKLVPNHVLRYSHIVIHLSIVDLKYKTDEIRQDCGASSLRLDRRDLLAWLRPDDGQPSLSQRYIPSMANERGGIHERYNVRSCE